MLPRIGNVCIRCSLQISKAVEGYERAVINSTCRRKYSSDVTHSSRPFRVAVIGSGPAGFYAAYRLMGKVDNAFVDMYEHLPVPFGLVRYGVAPDHPEVKNCQDKFTEVANSSRFNFIGNVELGAALPLRSLKPHYDAILFSYGASKDRELGIPGERDIRGIYSARAFVGWYNGLPEYRDLKPGLASSEEAVVIGQGNVAMDVARVLLTDVDILRKTDMAEYALEELSRSKIKRVRVVGRRGPMQGAFTIKEIRELLQLPSVSFEPIPEYLFPPVSAIKRLPRAQKRITELLAKGSSTDPSTANRSGSLDFLLSPHSFHTSPKNQSSDLSYIKFTRNQLDPSDPFSRSSRATPLLGDDGKAMQVDIPASVCFRSIGYQSVPLEGFEDLQIPFNASRGIIPNDGQGRIIDYDSSSDVKANPPSSAPEAVPSHLPGLYCAGWVKRGPTGVIASTMTDAFATGDAIAADWAHHVSASSGAPAFLNSDEGGSTGLGWEGVRGDAEKLGLRPTSWKDWEAIDRAEVERGKSRGKIREKFGRVEEMLDVLS
ncbi:NADPH-adrenodoxin reductase Arh1 [Coccidioides immitis RS]|uniref:NADPH:adrenodoxin oxidoreductase, mitochondrial n=2 Tax=Coccidioides immitis TaxID=5501 RepID=J3KF06_COCIM|nr:NADPH-adrenodoxin reductase Arh1 [Coccidioides immitis RS]EAS34150.3 NADPH-adrenodoxin reductase Arh1 [Coccidioides immitis RS]KMU92453.1 NADPH:adrenodoxin oxidoreductase [Coccidioides immitis H538.4]TPX21707.1 NADPH-adrenodoxin reductase [Coccidioides immitis]